MAGAMAKIPAGSLSYLLKPLPGTGVLLPLAALASAFVLASGRIWALGRPWRLQTAWPSEPERLPCLGFAFAGYCLRFG